MNPTATTVLEAFKNKFANQPSVYYSPGRINLIGEHVDYNDGFVLPAAINTGMYYAIAANNTDKINFYAADFDETWSGTVDDVKALGEWKNYVLSVVNEFKLLGKNIGGFDCVFGGDIPIGSGMSSSAAVEGGLAFAMNELFQWGLSRKELALLCQRAEHNYPNVKCGIMDMYANLFGKKDQVILLDCRSIEHEYFPMPLEDYCIVMINSKVHHSLASGEYNVRRKRCEEGMAIMKAEAGVQSFRDANIEAVLESCKARMDANVYNCCKYVTDEISRTKKAVQLLADNDLPGFGKLMYATHEGLSKLYEVSCKELDFLVDYAASKKVPGSRLMGGGFGGCTINIVSKGEANQFIEEVSAAYLKAFNIKSEAYIVAISNGVEKLEVDA